MTPEAEPRMLELEECLSTGHLVAFVGSGASCGVYDEWKDLVRKIYRACFSDDNRSWDTMSAEALINAAEEAKNREKHSYYAALGKAFTRKPSSRNVCRYLAGAAFRNYVTTNFDNLLADELAQQRENAVSKDGQIVFPYPGHMSLAFDRLKTVVHIHGYIKPGKCPSDTNPIVLARSEFDAAYSDKSHLVDFLRQLLIDHPVCFVGCSLQELPLQRVLDQVQSIRQHLKREFTQPLPPLFILLEKWPDPPIPTDGRAYTRLQGSRIEAIRTETEEDETRYYETFGLCVVRYPLKSEHMGLDDLLRRWAKLREAEVFTPNWGEKGL